MTANARTEQSKDVYSVDPSRLAHGKWCHLREKTIGQGDISASYSADRIGMGRPVRKPFEYRGSFWLCIGSGRREGIEAAEAYRLVSAQRFIGTPTNYREKLVDSDAARADPDGFYHGMTVKHAGQAMVLCGPPVQFIAGETQQLDLFGGEKDLRLLKN